MSAGLFALRLWGCGLLVGWSVVLLSCCPTVLLSCRPAGPLCVGQGDDYVMSGRCSLMLRGLGHMLNQHRAAATAWRPFAERVVREAGQDPDDPRTWGIESRV